MILGAFLFGIGMQIAGACASGSMFAAGSGSLTGLVTILGFIGGVTAAAYSFESWSQWPALPTVSFTHQLGGAGATLLHITMAAATIGGLAAYERLRRGRVEGLLADRTPEHRLTGRWPLLWGAIGLGLAALLILIISVAHGA